jgi:hypothetical protein
VCQQSVPQSEIPRGCEPSQVAGRLHAVSSGGGVVAVLETSRSQTVPRGPEFLGESGPVPSSLRPSLLHTHEVRGSSPLAPRLRSQYHAECLAERVLPKIS